MPIHVRDYRSEDLETCRVLWRALNQRHRDIYADPTIGGEDPGLEFDAHLAREDLHAVWLAESNDRIVGLCGLLVSDGETELEPIVVEPAQRGRGIGRALLLRALAASRALGADYFNVRPVSRNREAIAFFRREGFDLLTRVELAMDLRDGSTRWGEHQTKLHGLRFDF